MVYSYDMGWFAAIIGYRKTEGSRGACMCLKQVRAGLIQGKEENEENA